MNTVFLRKRVISFGWASKLGNMYLNDHCSWIVSILKYNSCNTNKIMIFSNLMLLIFLNAFDSLIFLSVIVISEIRNSDWFRFDFIGVKIMFLDVFFYNCINPLQTNHGRRRSNSIDNTVTTLWLRCSSSSDFTHNCNISKFIRLHTTNSKHFCSF